MDGVGVWGLGVEVYGCVIFCVDVFVLVLILFKFKFIFFRFFKFLFVIMIWCCVYGWRKNGIFCKWFVIFFEIFFVMFFICFFSCFMFLCSVWFFILIVESLFDIEFRILIFFFLICVSFFLNFFEMLVMYVFMIFRSCCVFFEIRYNLVVFLSYIIYLLENNIELVLMLRVIFFFN